MGRTGKAASLAGHSFEGQGILAGGDVLFRCADRRKGVFFFFPGSSRLSWDPGSLRLFGLWSGDGNRSVLVLHVTGVGSKVGANGRRK